MNREISNSKWNKDKKQGVSGVSFSEVGKRMYHWRDGIWTQPERSEGTSSVKTWDSNFPGERTARIKQF